MRLLIVSSEQMKLNGWEQVTDDPKVWVKSNIAIDSEHHVDLMVRYDNDSLKESLFTKLGLFDIGQVVLPA